ncbi:MAG: hypothetical protein KC621_02770 [Myxococcales bacterium]|nr:hypothetical protein [Myxococcales bacterium]
MRAAGNGVGWQGLAVNVPSRVRTNDWWGEAWHEARAERNKRDVAGMLDHAKKHDVDPEVVVAGLPFREDAFRGAIERRIFPDDVAPSEAEAEAGRMAMLDAGIDVEGIDGLMTQSAVPDFPMPRNTGLVAHRLGLRPDVFAADVDTGCNSFLTMLTTASALVHAGQVRRVLTVASSLGMRGIDPMSPASTAVGEAVAAGVVGEVEEGHGFVAYHAVWHGEWHGALRQTCTTDHPWYRGDLHQQHMFAHVVDPVGTHEAGARAATHCRSVVLPLFEKAGVTADDIDFFAMSTPMAWFPQAMGEAIGIDPSRRLTHEDHFQRYGHPFGASVSLNLQIAWQQGRLKKGDLVLLYSPGVGFSFQAMLYRWNLDRPPTTPIA